MKLLTTLITCFAIFVFGGCAESDPDTDIVESVPLLFPLRILSTTLKDTALTQNIKDRRLRLPRLAESLDSMF